MNLCSSFYTSDRRQSKTLILLMNIDKKLFETEFLIAICRQTGDKWQSKTLFLAIFDLRLSIVKSVFDCRLPGVFYLEGSLLSGQLVCRCAKQLRDIIPKYVQKLENIIHRKNMECSRNEIP